MYNGHTFFEMFAGLKIPVDIVTEMPVNDFDWKVRWGFYSNIWKYLYFLPWQTNINTCEATSIFI